MAPLVLAAVLWRAAVPLTVPNGETRTVVLPAVTPPARLAFRVRADYPRFAGSNLFLRLLVNGAEVGLMRDRRTPRLVGTLPVFGPSLQPFEFGRWRVAYGPSAGRTLVLDVSDLVHADAPNTVAFEHGPASAAGPTPLVVDDLRMDRGDASPGRAAPEPPPDWTTPRLALPRPPRFSAHGDDERVVVEWSGRSVEVGTTIRGGVHELRRTIVTTPTHVEVHDAIRNLTAERIGLRVRHAVRTGSAWVHLGGRTEPDVVDAYDPWNPTVFTPVPGGGVGLVAEDDVLRQQVHVDWDAATDTVGLRTDMLCLGAGETGELVWSVYPTRTDDYWDFVNTLRRDWRVNRRIRGGYLWFTADQILAMPADTLAAALARRRVAVASMWGGWVDPSRSDDPPRIGFGTAVLGDDFAALRARIRTAIARLHAARPGITVLVYFDAQRDSAPDAPRRWADSLLTPVERTDWGGRYSPSWSVVPTAANGFGRALPGVAAAMRDLGADGLYWDEMDAVDYTAPRVTHATWDGRSCAAEDAPVGLANLLSDDVKVALVRATPVLGNSPPTTRRLQRRLAMIEGQHNRVWGAFAHLSTPLAYIGGRRDFGAVVEQVDAGLLVAATKLDYAWDAPRLFPFTPEYIQPGTLRGRERIVTTRSGTHGWLDGARAVRAFRYDTDGREHRARWHVKRRGRAVLVRVRLAVHELAVLERVPHAAP
jgi:hypothetical protein